MKPGEQLTAWGLAWRLIFPVCFPFQADFRENKLQCCPGQSSPLIPTATLRPLTEAVSTVQTIYTSRKPVSLAARWVTEVSTYSDPGNREPGLDSSSPCVGLISHSFFFLVCMNVCDIYTYTFMWVCAHVCESAHAYVCIYVYIEAKGQYRVVSWSIAFYFIFWDGVSY